MRYIKTTVQFFIDILQNRDLLWNLTKKDLKQRYLGSYLGILWAFIQPVISVMIFWFVFQIGFKSMPVDNFPFILWLVCGMFPWFFISDSVSSATDSIISNSYLVKKVVFRVSLLPIVKLLAAMVVHLFFVAILFLMFGFYGYFPTIYNLQVFYYLFAMFCMLLGLSWLTSALVVFLKDIGQIVGMLLQFGFWGTPIFWSLKMIPNEYAVFLKLNPAYYIIEGYRNSFIYEKWFWQDWHLTIYYWIVTLLIMFVGAIAFRKLRPHFADVL
jgi:ABC-type polysaccharide/polyol phosphate export permease